VVDLSGKSDSELFDECVLLDQAGDQDRCRKIVSELGANRATRSIFDHALVLAASDRPGEARVGIYVLNDFDPKKNFLWREETVGVLVSALENPDSAVVASAVSALGKFGPAAASVRKRMPTVWRFAQPLLRAFATKTRTHVMRRWLPLLDAVTGG
jgi:HEAT repeat protein